MHRFVARGIEKKQIEESVRLFGWKMDDLRGKLNRHQSAKLTSWTDGRIVALLNAPYGWGISKIMKRRRQYRAGGTTDN